MKMHKNVKKAKKLIKKYLGKWLKPLGLLWWDVTVIYYDDPEEIIKIFTPPESGILVCATTWADWRYGTATLCINLSVFENMVEEKVEVAILHELIHILVNEMKEGEQKHEERVVTQIQKAFLWTEQEFSQNGKK
jgi:hypothetical protein